MYNEYEFHDFLLDASGCLHDAMHDLADIRSFIDNLPETASSFRLKQIEGIYQPMFDDVHLEFCKAWRLHDIYAPTTERVFVNPNYAHAQKYTDIVMRCQCGAKFTRNYADDHGNLRDEHAHVDDCLPHWRLEARADMAQERYELMHRLGELGWKGMDMAPRFGTQPSSMGAFAAQYHTTLRDVYNEYRRLAGNTYAYLVQEENEPPKSIAAIYDHAQSTMTRWAHEYADVEYDTRLGRNQHT